MEQISIGRPIDTSLIKCCSCGKGYDFKNNIYENNILVCPHCGLKHKIDFKLFNNKIGNLIKVGRLNLTDIDIGCPAIDRPNDLAPSRTAVNKGNPANANGKISRVEIFAFADLTNVEVATFYVVSGNNLSTRDTHYIGAVASGAKRTFAVDLDVETGDYIGIYFSGGPSGLDIYASGGAGLWYTTGDHIPCSNYTFTLGAAWIASLYGYSVTLFEYVGTGTFAYSGNAIIIIGFTYAGSGNFVTSGSGSCYYEKSDWGYAGSGVFNYSGEAIQSHTKYFLYDTSGNFIYSGSATQVHIRYYLYEGIGVFTYLGDAVFSHIVFWSKVTKEVGDFTKVVKAIGDWTKVDKDKEDWDKGHKE